jgi:uncharacterized membrane protein YfcA
MLELSDYILIFFAAIAAGFVNALAGGGTLITFPTLTFVGVEKVVANITNTVALLPGYVGGTLAQRKDLNGQERRLLMFIPAGIVGGLVGGFLLLNTGEKLFSQLIPYLILLACGLLAVQDPVRAWLLRRSAQKGLHRTNEVWAILPVGLAAVYGGYFGAGLSVIYLAILGLVLEDSLTRLNGMKQILSFSTNLAAAVYFFFSGKVIWSAALVMAVGALFGGALGGKLAGQIKPAYLRWTVVTIGVIVAIIYLVR